MKTSRVCLCAAFMLLFAVSPLVVSAQAQNQAQSESLYRYDPFTGEPLIFKGWDFHIVRGGVDTPYYWLLALPAASSTTTFPVGNGMSAAVAIPYTYGGSSALGIFRTALGDFVYHVTYTGGESGGSVVCTLLEVGARGPSVVDESLEGSGYGSITNVDMDKTLPEEMRISDHRLYGVTLGGIATLGVYLAGPGLSDFPRYMGLERSSAGALVWRELPIKGVFLSTLASYTAEAEKALATSRGKTWSASDTPEVGGLATWFRAKILLGQEAAALKLVADLGLRISYSDAAGKLQTIKADDWLRAAKADILRISPL